MATTGDATLAVPCPDCGELSQETIERLANCDVVPCSLCGGLIDLAAENCRAQVKQAKASVANARA